MTDKELPDKDDGPWNHIIQELRRRLDDLATAGRHTNRDIQDLQNCMRDLSMHQSGRLTADQIVALTALLLMKERKSWLFSRLRFYVGTSVGAIAAIFIFRTWIADLFSFLATMFKSG